MNRKRTTSLIGVAVILGAAGFALGVWTRRTLTPPASANANSASEVSGISAASARAAAAAVLERGYVLLDNRTPGEYAAAHLPGALLMPYDTIEDNIAAAVPRLDAVIKLYCRSGRRSGIARETLQKLGYTRVENLGGINAAAATLNLTVETPSAPSRKR